jgi:hypothetical protein
MRDTTCQQKEFSPVNALFFTGKRHIGKMVGPTDGQEFFLNQLKR